MKSDSTDWGKARDQVRIKLEVQKYERLCDQGDYASVNINRRKYFLRREVLPGAIRASKESSEPGHSPFILTLYSDFVVDAEYSKERQGMIYKVIKDRNGAPDDER